MPLVPLPTTDSFVDPTYNHGIQDDGYQWGATQIQESQDSVDEDSDIRLEDYWAKFVQLATGKELYIPNDKRTIVVGRAHWDGFFLDSTISECGKYMTR